MTQVRSNYSHQIKEVLDHKCMIINDLDLGNMSVTNDIENVVEEIGIKENLDPKTCIVVYRDSDDLWDGWEHNTEKFVILRCIEVSTAINLMIKQKKP